MKKGPTHFRCLYHEGTLPLNKYIDHINEEHQGLSIPVFLREQRCEHGEPIIDGFMFCCDYESW